MADNGITTAIISIKGKLDPSVQKSVNKATKGMNGLKIAAAASAAAIGAAAIASAKKLLDLGSAFDGAYDTIRIGTGATGKALEGLKGDFEKVFASMPTSTESAATAIADLNTRLGINGKTLQTVSKQAIYLSENLGAGNLQGIIEKTSQAFQGFGVQEDEMSAKMDYLFKVSQSTGIGYEDLASKVQQYALTFKDLGYSFEESAALIGQLEKAGVNTDQAMAAMRTSIGKLAAGGKSAAEGFNEYYEKIKNAADATEAANIAAEIFGTKNGAQMARAIRDGTMACGALVSELTNSTETIEGASLDTMDFAEKMQILKNKMSVSLAPLGNSVFDSMNALMPLAEKGIGILTNIIGKFGKVIPQIMPKFFNGIEKITAVITGLIPVIEKVIKGAIDWIKQLMPAIKGIFKTVVSIVKKLFPIVKKLVSKIIKIVGKLMPFITKIIEAILPVVQKTLNAIMPIIEKLLDAIMPVLEEIFSKITPLISKLMNLIGPIIQKITDLINRALSHIMDVAMPIIEGVVKFFTDKFAFILTNIMGVVDIIKALFNGDLSGALDIFKNLVFNAINYVCGVFDNILNVVDNVIAKITEKCPAIGAVFAGIRDILQPVIDSIKNIFGGLTDFVSNVFTGNWSAAWESVKYIFENVVSGITGLVNGFFDNVSNVINNVIAKISEKCPVIGSVFAGIWDSLQPVIESIKNIFTGLIDFVSNVFTGNWRGAWESVKDIFKNVFSGLTGIVKAPLNGVIGIVNKVIQSINGVGFTIPDWVPVVGGKAFSLNIPEIPTFATGGIATQPSICGEGGYPEYVITTDPKYRLRNIDIIEKAATALNVNLTREKAPLNSVFERQKEINTIKEFNNFYDSTAETKRDYQKINIIEHAADTLGASTINETTNNNRGHSFKIEFAPVINCSSGNSQDILQAIRAQMPEFIDMIQSALLQEAEGAY